LKLAGFNFDKVPAKAAEQYAYYNNNKMIFDDPEPGNQFFYINDKGIIGHTGFVKAVVQDADRKLLQITIIDSVAKGEHNEWIFYVDERTIDVNTTPYWKNSIAGYGAIYE
jgi:hypothetical protein